MRFHVKNATKRQGQHFAKLIKEFDLPVTRIETFETLVDGNGDKVNVPRIYGNSQYRGYLSSLGYDSDGNKLASITDKYPSEELDFYGFRRRIFDLAGKPYKKTFREWLVGF